MSNKKGVWSKYAFTDDPAPKPESSSDSEDGVAVVLSRKDIMRLSTKTKKRLEERELNFNAWYKKMSDEIRRKVAEEARTKESTDESEETEEDEQDSQSEEEEESTESSEEEEKPKRRR